MEHEQDEPIKGSVEETHEKSTLALPMKGFGESLIQAAESSKMEEARTFLVTEVTNLQKYSDEARQGIRICTYQNKFYQEVLRAINDGEFHVTRNGRIIFKNDKLHFGRVIVPGQIQYHGDVGGVDTDKDIELDFMK